MTDNAHGYDVNESGFNRLPLHLRREPRHKDQGFDRPSTPLHIESQRKRFPESLHFTPSNFRLRSRTASTRSSISSANLPDSATTYSPSTLASPISSSFTSFTSDIQDLLAAQTLDESRPPSRFRHRHKPSNATCSTFVNDEDDGLVISGYPDFASKINLPPYLVPEPEQESRAVSPMTEAAVKEEDDATPGDTHEWPPLPEPALDNAVEPAMPKWDTSSTASDDFSLNDVDAVVDYTLQLVYGVDLNDTAATAAPLRQLVSKCIRDMGQHIWQAPSDTQLTQTMSVSSTSTPSQAGGNSGSQGSGKRKKQITGRDEEGDEFSDGEGSGFLPVKRSKPNPKEEENLRLSCPFRKRNPQRFNVRDHHSCAMTYFPKFAELRQHIVKQHKRDDPSAFVCDRCNRDFRARKELRDHQRLPKEQMCDISDNDPEAGIDGPTSNKLLSRKRASGTSPEVQWREIWNILFPDDEDVKVQPYYFIPVIEHFELSSDYLHSFDLLQISLRDKISNIATLETLATKFQQCFIETVERCIAGAQIMPYANRSNKRNEPSRPQSTQSLIQRKGRDIRSRPDSGVVIDDISEESGSVMGMAGGLAHKDSVRTIRSAPRRGSNLVADPVREVVPTPEASVTLDHSILQQFSMPLNTLNSSTGPMNPAAVQAWTNSVLYHHQGDAEFATPDQLMATPQTEFAGWSEAFYGNDLATAFNGMENGFEFPAFNNR